MTRQVEIVQSVCSGSEVEEFLNKHKLKLEDCSFEKRSMNRWDDYESVVIYAYRDATPDEVIEIEKKEEAERAKRLAYRKAEFERLKKEFES